jgi:NADPH:quinone reductase-like Zn-dependent oxidoreductase
MQENVPDRALALRSLVTTSGTVELSLVEVDVPVPREGQVLIRVEAAPINPSDLGTLLAGADLEGAETHGSPDRPVVVVPLPDGAQRALAARVGRSLPVGNEGAGTVVAAGSSAAATAMLGRRVAAAAGGMYAQYRIADAGQCLVLPDSVSTAAGAASFVNPMTAVGMIETMRLEGHRALVHTAAASNLGQMLNRLCQEEGVGLVNVVRSPAQVDLLRVGGARHVCDVSSETFLSDLNEALAETNATLVFDAIGGGSLVSQILGAMEAVSSAHAEYSLYGSTVLKQAYLYGSLDRSPTTLVRNFGMAWSIGGWLLTNFLARVGADRTAAMRSRVVAGLTTTFASQFSDTVSLAGALHLDALATYAKRATGHKYLVVPTG